MELIPGLPGLVFFYITLRYRLNKMLKVGDLCVANYFGQWFNSKIRELSSNMATVEFIGSNHVADIFDGDDVAADVPISSIKPFGLFAVNKNGELTSSGSQSYHGSLKVWLKFCAKLQPQ